MSGWSGHIMYIYNLPHQERRELCRILDQNDKWEELGGTHMKFDVMTLQDIRRGIFRGHSPTEELLTMWGHQNHTVLELFILLSNMQHYQSMITLKPFVEPKYHKLIYEGEHNLSSLIQMHIRNKNEPCTKDLGIAEENFDNSPKILNRHVEHLSQKDGMPQPIMNPRVVSVPQPIASPRFSTVPQPILSPRYTTVAQPILSPRVSTIPQPIVSPRVTTVPQAIVSPRVNTVPQPVVSSQATANTHSREDNESVIENNNTRANQPATAGRFGNMSPVSESAGAIPHIPYQELQGATNNWDSNTILGKGGFGTVFKGMWKCTLVAIKRIEQREDTPESNSTQLKQSITELHCLNAYRHDNVLPLYGYSISGPQPCLVYQYMPGGCLEQRLRVREPQKALNWHRRLSIAKGVARGLQFLHTIGDKPLIHGDIKSANILLDLNDEPRIGDFGLAREGPHSDYTHMKVSRIHGTRPYLPDEFLRAKQISTKVDTYSFGVVLFEIATGLSAYNENRPNKFLKDHVTNYEGDITEIRDKRAGTENESYFLSLIEIGKVCVSRKTKDRPEMRNVLLKLVAVNS